MKFNKLLEVLLLISVLCLCISAVSAADDVDIHAVATEEGNLAVENNAVINDGDIENDVKLGVSNSDEILQADPAQGSYKDLQDLIDANYGGSIDLDRDYAHKNKNDLSQITISDKITINGNNHKINGKYSYKLLFIEDSASSVYLKDINFVSGRNNDGGVVGIYGNNNIIDNCTFNNLHGKNSALHITGKNNVILDSTFELLTEGGAITIDGDYNQIIDSEFNSCFSDGNGSAINIHGSESSIYGSVFKSCIAANGCGGAIYVDGEKATIEKSEFNENYAQEGGAIYFNSKNGVIDDCTFNKNLASYSGSKNEKCGGAVTVYGDDATIKNSKFNENDAKEHGGSVYVAGSNVLIENSEFNGNKAGNEGGAIFWDGDDGTLYGSSFSKNHGSMGGAVRMSSNNGLINKSTFKDNDAFYTGGGVAISESAYVDDSKFIDNHAYKGGGLFWIQYDGRNVLNNSYFESNSAGYGGGAVGCDMYYDNAVKIIENTEFVNNNAVNYGGAVAVLDTDIHNSTFKNNNAHLGGAIHSYDSKISDSTFENNQADYGNDIYGYKYTLVNTQIPDENKEIVENSEIIEILGDLPDATSTRETNIGYIAFCNERWAYYPHIGSRDDTLRGVINAKTGEDISEYLKILVYTFFNSKDDVYPHEGDNFVDEDGNPISRPNYYSTAVHQFSDFDFRTSEHPVVKKVLELYNSGFRVPENGLKYVDGNYIKYIFTSIISPASQSMFLFDIENVTPNLTVDKVSLTPVVYVGDLTSFNITVSNTGNCSLSNVVVTESYNHNELQYVVHSNETKWIKTDDIFTYQGILGVNENVTLTIWFKTLTNGTLLNNVTAKSDYTKEAKSNNTTTVYKPGFKVEKITLNPVVYVGNQTSFTIIVRNTGDCDLGDVFVVEKSYNGLVYNSYVGDKWTKQGNKFIYNDILKVGQSASFNITFDTVEAGNFTNVVVSGSNVTDNKTTNNTTKVLKPSLKVEKITLTSKVKLGQLTSFKIIVTNTGDCKLGDVFVIEKSYDGLEYYKFTGDKWSKHGNMFKYEGVLAPGKSASFTIFFKTIKEGNFTNVVVAGSNVTGNKTTENTTEVVDNKTTPSKENKTPSKDNKTTHEKYNVPKEAIHKDITLATGNPLFALLVVLIALGVVSKRKK